MTKDQVKKIRNDTRKAGSDNKPLAHTLVVTMDTGLKFSDTADFVVYDDSNELINIIKPNTEDPRSNAEAPFRVVTGSYSDIKMVEAFYTAENFYKALKDNFVGKNLLTQAQYQTICDWAAKVAPHFIQPTHPAPYFDTEPVLPATPGPRLPERRSDGVDTMAQNHLLDITKQNELYQAIHTKLENAGFDLISYNHYKMASPSMDVVATNLKNAINLIPGMIRATVSSDTYNTSVDLIKDDQYLNDNFVNDMVDIVLPRNPKESGNLTLWINAEPNIRVTVSLLVERSVDENGINELIANTRNTIERFFTSADNGFTLKSMTKNTADIIIDTYKTSIDDVATAIAEMIGTLDADRACIINDLFRAMALYNGNTSTFAAEISDKNMPKVPDGTVKNTIEIENVSLPCLFKYGLNITLTDSSPLPEVEPDRISFKENPEPTYTSQNVIPSSAPASMHISSEDLPAPEVEEEEEEPVVNEPAAPAEPEPTEPEPTPEPEPEPAAFSMAPMMATAAPVQETATAPVVEGTEEEHVVSTPVEEEPETPIIETQEEPVVVHEDEVQEVPSVPEPEEETPTVEPEPVVQEPEQPATKELTSIDDIVQLLSSGTTECYDSGIKPNTYEILTADKSLSDSGVFDKLAAHPKVVKIVVEASGVETIWELGDDINILKKQVDALCPEDGTEMLFVLKVEVTTE